MEIWLSIMVFILGLCFGSFVNMLTYRISIKYGMNKPITKFQDTNKSRSYCDYCGKQLHWYENVPVISWLLQKGKSRCCRKKLSVLYPIVEIMMGIFFLVYWIIINNQTTIIPNNYQLPITNYQTLVEFIIGLVIIVFLVFSAMFDLKYMILPDFSTVILVSGSLVLWFSGHFGDWNYMWSAAGSFLFLYCLYLITKKKGMGFGDVKLAFFMGLFLGYPKIITAMYVAFIFGAVFGLILIMTKKANKRTKISFGPFLIFGVFIAWFWGSEIWYLISSILH